MVKNISLRKEEGTGRETMYACIAGAPRMSEGRESQAGRKRSDSDRCTTTTSQPMHLSS
jgi:hypothetical protein